MTDATMDRITVLTSAEGLRTGAKLIEADSKRGGIKAARVQTGQWFTFSQTAVHDFASMAEAFDRISRNPAAYVVRGEPREGVNWKRARRLQYDQQEEPASDQSAGKPFAAATLREESRRWVALDIDKMPLPAGSDLVADPEGAIEHALGQLPPECWDARCWWMLSASAGLNGGDALSARIVLWLDRPYSSAELIRWARAHNDTAGRRVIDEATLRPVQPIYVAAPVFARGVVDPLPRRSGIRDGLDDAVTLAIPAEPERTGENYNTRGHAPGQGFAAFIARMAPGQGFRNHIVSAISSAVATGVDQAAAFDAIRARIREVEPQAHATDPSLIKYQSDRHLRDLWRWATNKETAKGRGARSALRMFQPTYPDRGQSTSQAQASITKAIGEFVKQATAEREPEAAPPVHLVRIDTGGGKSREAIEAVVDYVESTGGHVAYFCPRHDLNNELVKRFKEHRPALSVAVWRGLAADDPDRPDKTMCLEPDLSGKTMGIGLDLQSVCRVCPSRDDCGYRRQRMQKAHVWLLAHRAMFGARPKPVAEPDLVVIDESFWADGLARGVRLAISTLDAPISEDAKISREDRDLLGARRAALAVMLQSVADGGRVTATHLVGAGLSAAACNEARAIEWKLKPAVDLPDGLAAEVLARRLAAVETTWTKLLPALWKALHRIAEGKPSPVTMRRNVSLGRMGSGDVIEMSWREEVGEAWAAKPTLLLDATAETELVRPFYPAVKQTADIEITTPHVRSIQVTDWAGSKRQLIEAGSSEAYNQSRRNARERVAHAVNVVASLAPAGRRVLVIAQQAVEEALTVSGSGVRLAGNVDVKHFNAFSGLDTFGQHAAVVVIGRPLPGVQEIESLAELLADHTIERMVAGHWPKASAGIRLAGGQGAEIQVPRHADPVAEAVRRAICDANVIQAIGRLRLCRRTPDNPATVLILTGDVALPLTVAAAGPAAGIWPSSFDIGLARHGVLPMAPDLLAKLAPDLWATPDAAKSAMRRAQVAPEDDVSGSSKSDEPSFSNTSARNSVHSSNRDTYKRVEPCFPFTRKLIGAPLPVVVARVAGRRGPLMPVVARPALAGCIAAELADLLQAAVIIEDLATGVQTTAEPAAQRAKPDARAGEPTGVPFPHLHAAYIDDVEHEAMPMRDIDGLDDDGPPLLIEVEQVAEGIDHVIERHADYPDLILRVAVVTRRPAWGAHAWKFATTASRHFDGGGRWAH